LEACRLPFLALSSGAIQLVPDGTLIFHLAVIVMMVVVLNLTLLRPVNRVLEDRDKRTKGSLREARQILANASEKLLKYEQRMREARAEGYMLLEADRTTSSQERDRKVAEVKKEVARSLHDEREKLMLDAEKVKAALEKDAAGIALAIAHQILHREVAIDRLPTSKED
jgi:F-type H+-transporting ATPase subunit b